MEQEVSPPVEPSDELDLDSILEDLPEDQPEAPPADITPDFTKPEYEKLSADFKSAMGVDLKDAFETFTQTASQLKEMTAKMQEMESQRTLTELQDAWDVTPKELDRRVDAVLKVYSKMSPAQVEKYNSLQGVQDIWASIESKKAGKVTPSTGGQKQAKGPDRMKASEIRDMMFNNPQLYSQNQAKIAEALRLGLVDQDN